MVGFGGGEDGVEEEGEFGGEGAGGEEFGGERGFGEGAGEELGKEAGDLTDGAGFGALGVGVVGGGEAEVAQAEGEVGGAGTGEGEADVEEVDAAEEGGMVGEGGEGLEELADEEQGQPGGDEGAAGEPGVEAFAVEECGDEVVGALVFAAVEDAEDVGVAEGGGALEELLEAGGVAGAIWGGDGDVEFDEAEQVVVEGETGDLVGAAPDFDGGALAVLADSVVAEGLEGHGGGLGEISTGWGKILAFRLGFLGCGGGMAGAQLRERVERAEEAARRRLLAGRTASGGWEGELSSSALATAVALLALGVVPEEAGHRALLEGGCRWLLRTQLADGGWGDTDRSGANVATSLLAWSALGLAGRVLGWGEEAAMAGAVERVEGWIVGAAGGLGPGELGAALEGRYGKDKTFAVPILMACAVGGRLGPSPQCWRWVSALPFELAALPREWFAALQLPVVSYALPALIAIGQARHYQVPVWGPWAWVRGGAVGRTRRLLREIQPEGGGFLEATPLTGFVAMALASAGAGEGEVVRAAVGFLRESVRADGSWPIDTNLATWGTTLAVKALGEGLPESGRAAVRGWLLGQQYREKHPYCLSAPGGWAWTDLPGGVPDADDTAGALLALRELSGGADREAAEAGARWLGGLQNRDGGMPTFCKGWGALPFDRSAPDLTAHALAAWQAWRGEVGWDARPSMRRAVAWLGKTQGEAGWWLPLWFGNEREVGEGNPVYGTAAVLKYLCRLPEGDFAELGGIRARALGFLLGAQQEGGGWSGGVGGGAASVEETGAALEALLAAQEVVGLAVPRAALDRGLEALLELTAEGTVFPAAPIGLYFARLWYYEALYPLIVAASVFRQARRGWVAARV